MATYTGQIYDVGMASQLGNNTNLDLPAISIYPSTLPAVANLGAGRLNPLGESGIYQIQTTGDTYNNCTFLARTQVSGNNNTFNNCIFAGGNNANQTLKLWGGSSGNVVNSCTFFGNREETLGIESGGNPQAITVVSATSNTVTVLPVLAIAYVLNEGVSSNDYANALSFDSSGTVGNSPEYVTPVSYDTFSQAPTDLASANDRQADFFYYYTGVAPATPLVGMVLRVLSGPAEGHYYKVTSQNGDTLTLDMSDYPNLMNGEVSAPRYPLSSLVGQNILAAQFGIDNILINNNVYCNSYVTIDDWEGGYTGHHCGISVWGGLGTRVWGNTIIRTANGYAESGVPAPHMGSGWGSGSVGIQDVNFIGTGDMSCRNSYQNNIIKGFRSQIQLVTLTLNPNDPSYSTATITYNPTQAYDAVGGVLTLPMQITPVANLGEYSGLATNIEVLNNQFYPGVEDGQSVPIPAYCAATNIKNLKWSGNVDMSASATVTPVTAYDKFYTQVGIYPFLTDTVSFYGQPSLTSGVINGAEVVQASLITFPSVSIQPSVPPLIFGNVLGVFNVSPVMAQTTVVGPCLVASLSGVLNLPPVSNRPVAASPVVTVSVGIIGSFAEPTVSTTPVVVVPSMTASIISGSFTEPSTSNSPVVVAPALLAVAWQDLLIHATDTYAAWDCATGFNAGADGWYSQDSSYPWYITNTGRAGGSGYSAYVSNKSPKGLKLDPSNALPAGIISFWYKSSMADYIYVTICGGNHTFSATSDGNWHQITINNQALNRSVLPIMISGSAYDTNNTTSTIWITDIAFAVLSVGAFTAPATSNHVTSVAPYLLGVQAGIFTSLGVVNRPAVAALNLAGLRVGSLIIPATLNNLASAAPLLTGVQVGLFVAPVISNCPALTPAWLTGSGVGLSMTPQVVPALSVIAPLLSGIRAGTFNMPSVAAHPSITFPNLFVVLAGIFSAPGIAPGVTVFTASLLASQGNQIRAPNGQPMVLRRITGEIVNLQRAA